MTEQEKIVYVQTLVDDSTATDALISAYLTRAKAAIFARMYPNGVPDDVTDIPSRYEMAQCALAERYFLRRGGEGEKAHSENGISRTFGSVNDEDILMEVMQVISL